MADERVIRGIVATDAAFVRGLKRVKDPQRQAQIRANLHLLLWLDLDAAPAKLHLHQLTNKKVASAVMQGKSVTPWTLHVTADDTYKASFTLEDGVAYMRLCDEHDVIDKNP